MILNTNGPCTVNNTLPIDTGITVSCLESDALDCLPSAHLSGVRKYPFVEDVQCSYIAQPNTSLF